MAKYKHYSYDQSKLIPIRYSEQIIPGTFEFALSNIVDRMDMSIFEERFKNDDGGAPAYDPAIMLKIVLFAYSRGIISSRHIARSCRENVVFMALSADSRPHFTTIASFVSSLGNEIAPLFSNVLAICAQEGLIGKNMFAIDGCKISSNCSKEWSGTKKDFEKKKAKLEKSVKQLLKKHRETDKTDDDDSEGGGGYGPDMRKREEEAIKKLTAKIDKIDRWMNENDDKKNHKGKVKKSNITDNDSAKMVSSRGVIQGYNGIAASDSKHQVIVHAEAFGDGHEGQLMKPVIEDVKKNLSSISEEANKIMKDAVFLMDSGYSSEENIKMVFEEEIDALIADNKYRQRDPAFKTAKRHKKPIDKRKTKKEPKYFQPKDFNLNKETGKLICPAGKELYLKNRKFISSNGIRGIAYEGKKTDCRVCEFKAKCMRNPNTEHRQVVKFEGRLPGRKSWTMKMIEKFDSARGRYLYSRRMGIVEPVFANICSQLKLNRFTLRSKRKVDIQWKLYCMVHNIGKIYRYGMAGT